jgi:glycosyltransferase involved in cell wall biosynthesis
MSRCVLAGNDQLATYARQFNPHVTVAPITIDTDAYTPRAWHPLPAVPTVGWSGSHSTVPHLDTIRAALAELAERRRFKLRVLGTRRYELPGVEVEAGDWCPATEVADLSTFDIGVMPLPDDQWTRLRSHLKVRQYMGVGVPSIVSPVGVNRELIQDGVNGYLAATTEQWLERLILLLDDHELRCSIGRAGRKTIESHYAARDWSTVVGRVLLEAAGGRTRCSTG